MTRLWKIRILQALLIPGLFLFSMTSEIQAQDRQNAMLETATTLFRPSVVKPVDMFYREYFSSRDKEISKNYRRTWDYHDSQIQYASTSWRHEYLSIGSLSHYGRAPHEDEVRKGLANQILRMRVETAFNTYLA